MYRFYVLNPGREINQDRSINSAYISSLWRPKLNHILPEGMNLLPFGIWWIFHYLRVFSNYDFCIYVIYDRDLLIHHSIVSPRYFRFPFMSKHDLQIGDTWTHEAYRNRGLASFAIQEIIRCCAKPNREFWYLVEDDNSASIRAVERTGFKFSGFGNRYKKFGIKLFGSFELIKKNGDEL